jgi:glyoxylase-like metal-dependent hydrolase (beta-lactamase superfamily II)
VTAGRKAQSPTADEARHDGCVGYVTQMGPTTWGIQLPYPGPLRTVWCYLLQFAGGPILVDAGWGCTDGWRSLTNALSEIGCHIEDIQGIVATHSHPDHIGLARRIKDASGAWLAAHAAERASMVTDEAQRRPRAGATAAWLRLCGVPSAEEQDLLKEGHRYAAGLPRVEVDIEVEDSGVVPGTGGSLVAFHTPGHTPGHICLHDRDRDVLLTGDHLLPRVTPNISMRPGSSDDPLGDYLHSLRRIAGLEGRPRVLPGHGAAFEGHTDRARQIHEHHRDRLSEVELAVHKGAATVWDVAARVTWSRPFRDFDQRARRQALGETLAHLESLRRQRRIEMVTGPVYRFASTVITDP